MEREGGEAVQAQGAGRAQTVPQTAQQGQKEKEAAFAYPSR